MAVDTPDAITLNLWEDAFKYPIPTVRRLEQELRRDAESNRDKLRSLVGVKYRDLLETAQTIVDMNTDIQQAESTLSSIGRRCNPRSIARANDRIHELNNDDSKSGKRNDDGRQLKAHLCLLRSCTNSIVKIIRERGSVVLAAKLLVVSRLLLKALSQNEYAPPFVNSLKKNLSSLRATILSRIKLRLSSASITTDRLVQALCAFCLATSSSSNDAIRHFCDVRKNAIGEEITENIHSDGVLIALQLYLQTLRQTDHLLSGLLSAALEKLTTQPLLADPEILCLGELNMDILKPWILEDIRHFTPWIKYNDIPKSERSTQLKTWSKNTFKAFSSQAKLKLEAFQEFEDVLNLRKKLLESWLLVQSSTPTHSNLEVLEGLRDIINHQLILILQGQSEGIAGLGKEITSVISCLSAGESGNNRHSLWDPKLASVDFSEGAKSFKSEVLNRLLGRGTDSLRLLDSYQTWLRAVEARASLIYGMKADNWEDIVEDDSDEDVIDHIYGCLTEDDPALLQEEHQKSLKKGFKELQAVLADVINLFSESPKALKAVFLLRTIREIRNKIPSKLLDGEQLHFAQNMTPELHTIIATDIVTRLSTHITKLKPVNFLRCSGRTLWEGKPELPVQPSPAAFKLLRKLEVSMEDLGPDLWNPTALSVLKVEFKRSINKLLEDNHAKELAGSKTTCSENGVAQQEQQTVSGYDSSTRRDWRIQLLFDLMYLENAVKSDTATRENSMSILTEALQVEDETMETLRKRSIAYWERTRLLFGLLGC
ncbi:Vacuolar protein sorting-associated protein 51 [Trichophyton interdigitale]|uniref:Conserved oligomeric Golgi complex subunit 1 n=1 Tax=Trichophyton interdigitale TaxID=101480 RepID=A0A9P5CW70_9EURO|nr:Vacuolar protein sorting-associated protein 51 [Trichophyton interdigitale]KAF3899380.1 Vacuolar protein sorting-associated protein 51 [Trichophyton interdigitale]KAG8212186.1 Vacuolar protein sorting-associated protein 51 [Trichophyton interdigitale]